MTSASATPDATITLRSPADLIAVVPYMFGFHPDDSAVLLAFTGRSVTCATRGDLAESPTVLARELLARTRGQATAVAILGYGDEARAEPAIRHLRTAAEACGLTVREAVRVDAGRWWSYVCDEPTCCPRDGTPFDAAASAVAASCTVQGLAALPSRRDLAEQVAPLSGPARRSMTAATDKAWTRLSQCLESVPDDQAAATVVAEGSAAVAGAVARYDAGERLDDAEAAWLSVLLQSIPVRDEAWQAIRSEQPHLRLWLDVTQRADPELAAPPASLLAFAAYRSGNGALARLALDRALREDSGYSLAQLLAQVVQQGVSPSVFAGWGTAEWSTLPADGQESLK